MVFFSKEDDVIVKLFKDRYPGYTIKGLKFFRGMEGDGFNATLYKDGRRVCLIMDDARGGMLDYEDLSDADEKMLKEFVEVKRQEIPAGKDESGFSDRESFDLDWMVNDMVTAWEFEAKLRRMTKKKTVIVTPDCKTGEAITIDRPFDATIKAKILAKYPGATIMNEVLV